MENETRMSETESQAAALTGHEFDGFLGKAFEEKPIWTGLYESIRDIFFPVKLPPLQLTSTPIPVPDRDWHLDGREYRHPGCAALLCGQEDH